MHSGSLFRSLLGLGTLAVAFATPACAAPDADEDVGEDSESALVGANSEFEGEMHELEALVAQCESQGECAQGVAQAAAAEGGGLQPQTSITQRRLCNTLRPLAALENPIVFVGASAKAAVIKTVADTGSDIVFDLAKRQMAAFTYKNHGVQNLVGAEVNAYFGYAFGRKRNVLEAWSGEFQTAEATVETPFLNLSAGGAIFRSPDNTVWGALVEASVGVNLLGPLGTVEVAASEGHWTPWDAGTAALGRSYWMTSYTTVRAPIEGRQHTYLQFTRARHEGLALVQTMGLLGVVPAGQALALEAMQKRGLTFARACGR